MERLTLKITLLGFSSVFHNLVGSRFTLLDPFVIFFCFTISSVPS